MYKLVLLISVLALVVNCQYYLQSPIVHRVNSANALWYAAVSDRFVGYTTEDLDNYFNAQVDTSDVPAETAAQMGIFNAPKSYDVREATGCSKYSLDQGRCGSCWAFGAIRSTTDRFCQALNDTSFPLLSPQHLVSCDWEGNMGCNGGFPALAMKYIEFLGITTEECYPYVSGKTQKSEKCKTKCHDGSEMKRYHLHKFSTRSYRKEEDMIAALIKYGSAEVAFTVYEDFMSYKGGIYHHVQGRQLGGHAVTLIGYGEENGVKYWLCANSWGSTWGEQGTFRILRGKNECGIESNGAVGGTPKL
ncbi:hypothetical protein P9112_004518 [Eukaryota sp. TZLM1-RC]